MKLATLTTKLDTNRLLTEAADALSDIQSELRKDIYKELTPDQERQLRQTYLNANTPESEKRKIKEQLVMSLMRYNLKVAVNYAKNTGMNFGAVPDLYQEGLYGILKAIDKFDMAANNRFNTYATNWMKAYMKGFNYGAPDVSVPTADQNAYFKAKKAAGVDADDETVAPLYKKTQLDAPVSSDERKFDIGSGEDVAKSLETKQFVQTIIKTLSNLKPAARAEKAVDIVKHVYGLDGYETLTPDEIAKQLDVSGNYVRNIKNWAEDEMRKMVNM
jgi:RNA polymerase sigma factor (sigma-70 family)